MSEWSKSNQDDVYKNRDQMLQKILDNSESQRELLAEFKKEFKEHLTLDSQQFDSIKQKQSGTDVKMAYYAGGLAVIGIILKLLFKV